MRLFRKKGFTLLELMIVVIIIGILATLAIPRFIKATDRAKYAEAKSILGTIRSAQMRYYLEQNNNYYASGGNITGLDIEVPTSTYFTYVGADAATSPTYIGGAEAKSSSGLKNLGIPENGAIVEDVTAW